MEVSPRKLIWADGMLSGGTLLQLAACRSQVAAHRCPGLSSRPPTTGGRRLGRADAVIAQEGQGDPESFAQFWVTGDSCDFVWFQGGSQCACWLLVALDHVASVKSGVM